MQVKFIIFIRLFATLVECQRLLMEMKQQRPKTVLFSFCVLSKCARIKDKIIILLLVEMWLNDSKIDAELGFKNYKTFQLFDKNFANNDLLHGGGVLIAVRNCLL